MIGTAKLFVKARGDKGLSDIVAAIVRAEGGIFEADLYPEELAVEQARLRALDELPPLPGDTLEKLQETPSPFRVREPQAREGGDVTRHCAVPFELTGNPT